MTVKKCSATIIALSLVCGLTWHLAYANQPILPPKPLSAEHELMYQVLLAQIANQRHLGDLSLEGFRVALEQSQDPKIAEMATHAAVQLRDEKATLEMATLWQQRAPDAVTPWEVIGFSYLRQKNITQSAQAFDRMAKLIQQEGKNGYAYLVQGFANYVDKPTAVAVLEKLADTHPDNIELRYFAARLLAADYRLPQAQTVLAQLLSKHPDFVPAILLNSNILWQSEKQEESLRVLKFAQVRLPDQPEIAMIYAEGLIRNGDIKAAVTQLQQVTLRFPERLDGWSTQGLLALDIKDYALAEYSFNHLLDKDVPQVSVWMMLARTAAEQGDYGKARDWLQKITPDHNQNMEFLTAQINLANLFAKENKFEQLHYAYDVLRLEYSEYRSRLYTAQAEVLQREQRYQDAYDFLSGVIVQYPNDMAQRYARGMVAERLNRIDLLESDLRLVLDKNPKDAVTLNALGYTLLDRTPRIEEAAALIEQALALNTNDVATIDSMGWVRFKQGKIKDALTYLKQAYEQQRDPEIVTHYIEALIAVGQIEKARLIFDKAIEFDKDNSALNALKEKLKW